MSVESEASAEADRIEADNAAHPEWPRLTVEETWHGCNSALDDAKLTRGKPEQHRYLVRLAAWATVALRAEAREQAAKGTAPSVDIEAIHEQIRRHDGAHPLPAVPDAPPGSPLRCRSTCPPGFCRAGERCRHYTGHPGDSHAAADAFGLPGSSWRDDAGPAKEAGDG